MASAYGCRFFNLDTQYYLNHLTVTQDLLLCNAPTHFGCISNFDIQPETHEN